MQKIPYKILLLVSLLLLACTGAIGSAEESPREVSTEVTSPDLTPTEDSSLSWTKVPMTDAVTGTQFTIDQLVREGKPVVLHSFAVWCPACLMQIQETERLLSKNPDSLTIVGIDIDPNENENMVKKHVEKHQFTGYFAAAPKELTRGLVETFGTGFALELPQTIIICNRTVNHIGSGLFREATLKSALSQVCS
jgi:thiol-disulfide isomerase/thioredoxin